MFSLFCRTQFFLLFDIVYIKLILLFSIYCWNYINVYKYAYYWFPIFYWNIFIYFFISPDTEIQQYFCWFFCRCVEFFFSIVHIQLVVLYLVNNFSFRGLVVFSKFIKYICMLFCIDFLDFSLVNMNNYTLLCNVFALALTINFL